MPQTWNALKQRMKSHFIPPYYQCDLCFKLQTLKQGDKGVEAYYQELLIGLARCGVNEDDADASACFFGALNHDIQNILITKNGINFPNCIILLLRQNVKYRDASNTSLSGLIMGGIYSSVRS